jgi:beta-aspartyl-peptidase (threonine type)
MEFAKHHQVPLLPDEWFFDEFRFEQWQQVKGSNTFKLDHDIETEKKFGTVGAVAYDIHGNLAAATSTGGMTNKMFGRVGDSPVIGAGTYANNSSCAVSCTGSGEYFLRLAVAHHISAAMEYGGKTLLDACNEVVLQKLTAIGGDGGVVAIDRAGNCALVFNTEGMYRAYRNIDGSREIAIYK